MVQFYAINRIKYSLAVLLFLLLGIGITLLGVQKADAASQNKDTLTTYNANIRDASSYIEQASKFFDANKKDEAMKSVVKAEGRLYAALRSKWSADPKQSAKLSGMTGYRMTTTLHADISGVAYTRRFESAINCWEAGCQGVPLSQLLQIQFKDGSIAVYRSHGSPLPGDDDDFTGQLDIRVLKKFGFFRTSQGEIILVYVNPNWRGDGWGLRLLQVKKGHAKKPAQLLDSQSFPPSFHSYWNEERKEYLGICSNLSEPCTYAQQQAMSISAIDEATGVLKLGDGKKVVLKGVLKSVPKRNGTASGQRRS